MQNIIIIPTRILQAAFGYDAQKLFNHFVSSGIYEGRSGCANFNVAIYRANYPDLQAAFGNDLASYCAIMRQTVQQREEMQRH